MILTHERHYLSFSQCLSVGSHWFSNWAMWYKSHKGGSQLSFITSLISEDLWGMLYCCHSRWSVSVWNEIFNAKIRKWLCRHWPKHCYEFTFCSSHWTETQSESWADSSNGLPELVTLPRVSVWHQLTADQSPLTSPPPTMTEFFGDEIDLWSLKPTCQEALYSK